MEKAGLKGLFFHVLKPKPFERRYNPLARIWTRKAWNKAGAKIVHFLIEVWEKF
jgi:hypothetical protein